MARGAEEVFQCWEWRVANDNRKTKGRGNRRGKNTDIEPG